MITNAKPVSPGPANFESGNYPRCQENRILLVLGSVLLVGTVSIGIIGTLLQ